jgi:hypothetical protein
MATPGANMATPAANTVTTAMHVAIPDTVRVLPLDHPDLAVAEFAAILGELRDAPPGAAADLELIATEAIDAARAEGTFLMAVVTPPEAAAAVLTGIVLEVPPSWSGDLADMLRDSLEDVGGPDVRETITVDTGLGPAVIVQRIPGVEQARARRPLTLQLQAFVPEPDSGRMLLLTLASPSVQGWAAHQSLFGALVASASAAPGRRVTAEEESFEHQTYRL